MLNQNLIPKELSDHQQPHDVSLSLTENFEQREDQQSGENTYTELGEQNKDGSYTKPILMRRKTPEIDEENAMKKTEMNMGLESGYTGLQDLQAKNSSLEYFKMRAKKKEKGSLHKNFFCVLVMICLLLLLVFITSSVTLGFLVMYKQEISQICS